MPPERANCRARIVKNCEEWVQGIIAEDDGTYDPDTETYVCDPCYVRVMAISPSQRGLLHEIEEAIAEAKRRDRGEEDADSS